MTTSSELSRVLARLKGVKGRGNAYTALCPAHNDTRQSLSVSVGHGGKILLKCHAGCTFREINTALDGAASSTRDAMQSAGVTSEELVATYVYTDEHEAPLYRVLRYDVLDHERRRVGKTFKQQRHIGAGEYEWKLGATRRVWYRLPAIIEAVAQERPIILVEGEKDADRLVSLGLDATTLAGGADARWLDEYGEVLKAATVFVLPDNDEAGQKYARKLSVGLQGIARSVRTVSLPGLGPKGDVSDWLDQGNTVEDLRRLLVEAPVEPDPYPMAVCLRDAPPPEPIRWAINGLLPASELALFYGDGGSYKSTLVLHLAAAVAGGYRAFGHFDAARRPVLIVSAEDPTHVIRNRVSAMCRGHGWNVSAVEAHLHVHALDGVTLADPKWCAALVAEVQRLNAGLVILDPLAELIAGEENSASEMRPMVQAARALKDVSNAAVVLVHHAGKESIGKRKQDRVRGSSAFYSAARSVYLVDRRDDGAGIECVKFSRADKRKPFVVSRVIESAPNNEAEWTLARFTYTPTKVAELDRAEAHIMAQLQGGVRLSTTDLRKSAQGTGISAADIQRSLKLLEMRRLVSFEGGDVGKAKAWFLVEPETLPDESRQGRQGLLEPCPAGSDLAVAGSAHRADTLPALYRAGSGQGPRFELAGSNDDPRDEAA